jgi:hypothetical protein
MGGNGAGQSVGEIRILGMKARNARKPPKAHGSRRMNIQTFTPGPTSNTVCAPDGRRRADCPESHVGIDGSNVRRRRIRRATGRPWPVPLHNRRRGPPRPGWAGGERPRPVSLASTGCPCD